jgi:hypothetical protein
MMMVIGILIWADCCLIAPTTATMGCRGDDDDDDDGYALV